MRNAVREWPPIVLLPLLLAVLLAAYYPAWHGGPVWDDDAHLTREALRSADGLYRIWFEPGATQQYYPIVHSAFWILHKIFGDATLGYHLVSICLHALSACLFAVVLRRLAVPGATLAAVIFALHPVHVESVAWITELKNTLSGAFYLVAALAYLRFDRERERTFYGAALVLFVLALLTKSVTASLPAAILVVLWWQRGRIEWTRDVRPLVPFFALGATAGLITAWIERTIVGAHGADYQFTLLERALIAGRAIWFYLAKLVWPADLVFVYPKWRIDQSDPVQYLYPLGALALAAALWALRSRTRAPLAALLFFAGTLFPALGFLNVYPFRYSFVADHFQYLASLGIIALAAAGAARLLDRPRVAWASTALLVAISVPLAVLTWRQSHDYADAETLYRATIRRNPAATMAYINLGILLIERPQPRADEARTHLETAVRLEPANAAAHVNLGAALQKLARFDEAASAYREALRLRPDDAGAHNNLGATLEQLGRVDQAVAEYRESLRLAPDSSATHTNLGRALLAMGDTDAAVGELRASLRLDPESATSHYLLGTALAEQGRLDDAVAAFQVALRDPVLRNVPEVHNDFGVVLGRLGRPADAAMQFREALRLNPNFDAARANLATAGGR
jgi:tetratricopeptide (TPR) repeat protein